MRTRAEAEAMVPKVRALLAEMGYGDESVIVRTNSYSGGWQLAVQKSVPSAVIWMAFATVEPQGVACYSCWLAMAVGGSDEASDLCVRGNCSHPEGPARPPRELLVPRR